MVKRLLLSAALVVLALASSGPSVVAGSHGASGLGRPASESTLRPLQEPATLFLLGVALLAIGSAARRRQGRSHA
jgi:hypothetical protein